MSRTQYLKSLEREVNAATKIINELTRENYELRQLLVQSTINNNSTRNEANSTKEKAF